MPDFKSVIEKWKNNVLRLDSTNTYIKFEPPRGAVEFETTDAYELMDRIIKASDSKTTHWTLKKAA